MSVKSLREQHAEATREAIMSVARRMFTQRGYAATGTEEICREVGVTRGALYHHFANKEELFEAVADEVAGELTTAVRRAIVDAMAGTDDPRPALAAGIDAFLDACVDGDFHRIVILEAPTIVGWNEWREHAHGHELELMEMGLRIAIDAKIIRPQPVELMAPLLMAVLNEGAMQIARADDRRAMRAEVGDAIRTIFDGLGL